MPGLTAKYLRTAPARSRDPAMDRNDCTGSVSSEGSAQDEQQTARRTLSNGGIKGRPSWRAAWSFLESQ